VTRFEIVSTARIVRGVFLYRDKIDPRYVRLTREQASRFVLWFEVWRRMPDAMPSA